MPSNHLILCHPLFLPPSIFPSIRVFSSESALPIRWPKYWSFSISPSMNIQGWFSLGWTGWILQSKGLKSLFQYHSSKASVLWCSAFFYGPTLTSIHDYRENHSFDSMDICWQRNVFAFLICCRVCYSFPSKEQVSFNFIAAIMITICNDSGTQENKVGHCFHCFLIYLPLSDGTRCKDLHFLNVEF